MPGVTIPFFADAIKSLIRQHGNRSMDSSAEAFRAALAEAETIFMAMPPSEKKKPKSKAKDSR